MLAPSALQGGRRGRKERKEGKGRKEGRAKIVSFESGSRKKERENVHKADTIGNESLGVLLIELVLGSRGESDVDVLDELPGASTLNELEAGRSLEVLEVTTLELELANLTDELGRETLLAGRDESALRVGEGSDDTTELDDLEGGELGDVTGTGDEDALALEVLTARDAEHLLGVVDATVTGGFRANLGSTEVEALTGEDTGPLVADGLVGTEEETDLASSNSDVTGGNVGVLADVAGELTHEGLGRKKSH
jgi:hypothetical protein